MTFCPVSVAKVRGAMNSWAQCVITTRTLAPALDEDTRDLGGFVGRDAASDSQE